MNRARVVLVAVGVAALVAIGLLWSQSTNASVAPIVCAGRNEVTAGEDLVAFRSSTTESTASVLASDLRIEVDPNELSPVQITIRCRVVDEMGHAIELFAVEAARVDERNNIVDVRRLPLELHPNGEFDLVGLARGRWAIDPQIDGMQVEGDAQFVSTNRLRVDLVMHRIGTVTVFVFDPERRPIADAVLSIDGSARDIQMPAGGFFELKLSPGYHSLRARSASFDNSTEESLHVDEHFRFNHLELTLTAKK